jgi:cell division protein FtsB
VKNLMIAAVVAAALSQLPARVEAASQDDLTQIREQLQGLMQRVDKLEQENQALKSENEDLKAQDDYLKAEARGLRKESASAANEINKVKGADWAGKVAITGDVRYRYETLSDKTLTPAFLQTTADRYRDRIRARFNATVKATDTITAAIGFATAEGGDPRSSNQSLTGVFTRKPLELDLAFFDWKFSSWGDLIGGKMKQPFVKPGQSLFWDNDINPEGLAINVASGMFFGTAYNFWLTEISGAETAVTADTMMHGLQIGARLPIGSATLMLAAHYYDLSAAQGRAPFFAANANGNTTINVGTPPTAVLLNDYEVINLSAEFNTMIGALPLQIWADAAQNQDPDDLETAWTAGVLFGKAGNYRTWEFGAAYEVLEKDAVFAQLIDSDFGAGVSDVEGWILRAGYAPVRNWTLNATYFLNNKRNRDVPTSASATTLGGQSDIDYDRLQVDFNVKF